MTYTAGERKIVMVKEVWGEVEPVKKDQCKYLFFCIDILNEKNIIKYK